VSPRSDAAAAVSTPEPTKETGSDRFRLLCPECGARAFSAGSDLLCPAEGRRFSGQGGVLPLLSAERVAALTPFLDSYRRVRRMEGWGGAADYYRSLPFLSQGDHRDVWKVRAVSFRRALREIARRFPDVKQADEWDRIALRVLEVGAGNGWFSFRLARAGHYVLATDVSLDEEDGLGAISRYARPGEGLERRLTRARAEMEELPLEDAQFDLVVASGSLHYAREPARAVAEAFRVLRPGGVFLVLDSPVYDERESGREMVRRRREHHRKLGIDDRGSTAGFLVEKDLLSVARRAGFDAKVLCPFEGLSRLLRRAYCGVRRATPPARFPLFVLEKS
jgi:SAM-dependent methyltransferase